MRLSRDATEALLLLGGFVFVVTIGAIVMLIWPTHLYGNWRLLAALAVATAIAVPTVLALRNRLAAKSNAAPGGEEKP